MRLNPTVGKTALAGSGVLGLILSSVFFFEGGYSNNPNDPGGETNYGITERVARSHGYQGQMINLTPEVAAEIYIKDYVDKPNYNLVLQRSPAVAHKLIDAGVNVGPKRSSCWFQKSLNSLNRGGADYPRITEDCVIGQGTMRAYDALASKRGNVKACELVIKLVDAQQAMHYIGLTNLNTFTVGWVDHRIGNIPLSWCMTYGGKSYAPNASD